VCGTAGAKPEGRFYTHFLLESLGVIDESGNEKIAFDLTKNCQSEGIVFPLKTQA
jgi:hypothetical protein